MNVSIFEYETREAQVLSLAEWVANDLRQRIAVTDRATLAVPGGTTPGPFLSALGGDSLDWSKVAVTLTDERWTPPDSPRSNQGLLAKTLLSGQAAAALFVPLYRPAPSPEPALGEIAVTLQQSVLPLDVCVLGMGEDMHTASLVPGAASLAGALDPAGCEPVLAIRAPEAEEVRITLTAPVLIGAGRIYILIQGAGKRTALERAMVATGPQEAPVRAVLDGATSVSVHYAD